MWFVLGALCGVAGCVVLCRKRHSADVEKSETSQRVTAKGWAETRNFLYYDGTVMPEIKEDLHEQ